MASVELETPDRDERLSDAVEAYLALAETGNAPDPEAFASNYPDLGGDLMEALEGLSLVRGLVGKSPGHTGQRLLAGCRLAGYRIVGELGSGGMGIVYEAVHVDLDRPVALKVLDARATRDGNGLRRFLNEAKTAAALHHTHIVPVFDVGHVGGLCYYAMQRIEGSGLDRLVKLMRSERQIAAGSGSGRGSWSWRRSPASRSHVPSASRSQNPDISGLGGGSGFVGADTRALPGRTDTPPPFEPPRGAAYYRWVAEVGRQAAQALGYAHRRGVVHRDIKPSNLLVDARGGVWVADFGLARRLADPSLTHSDSLIGTPRYMSPEQVRAAPIDGRCDVYSLGATLYELLTLHPPFDGRTTAELFDQIGRDEPIAPSRLNPRVPRDLETIVLKALSKRPGDRYPEAVELAEDLERFLNREPVKARRIGPIGRTWRFAQRHPALSIVTVGSIAAILAIATIGYVRVAQERDRANQLAGMLQKEFQEGLLRQATLVRNSTEPNRREQGLNLLTQAAGMNPDASLRSRLRSEAIAFLTLRDLEQGRSLATRRSAGIAFGPDGSRVATVAEDRASLTFWSVANGKPIGAPKPTEPARNAQGASRQGEGFGTPPVRGFSRFSASGSRVASAGTMVAVLWPDGRGVRLFDGFTGTKLRDFATPGRDVIALHGMLSVSGPRLLTIDRPRLDHPAPPAGGPDRQRGPVDPWRHVNVTLWDPDHPETPLATLAESGSPDGRGGDPGQVPILALAPDGETIATAWSGGGAVTLHTAADGQPRGDVLDTGTAISALALDAFDHLAVAGGGAVRLWELNSRTPIPGINPHKNFVRSMRFSPDGTLLALAGGFENDIELWDPAANTLVAALTTTEPVTELAFSPNGRHLAAGLPSGVALWALVDSAVVTRTGGFEAFPYTLAFGPEEHLALAFFGGNADLRDLRVWSPARCPTSVKSLAGSRPNAIAFDAAGRLATLDSDRLAWYDAPDFQGPIPVASLELPDVNSRGGSGGRGGSSPGNWARAVQTLSRTTDGRTLLLTRYNQVFLWRADDPDRISPIHLSSNVNSQDRDPRRGGPAPPWNRSAIAPSGNRLYLASILPGPGGSLGDLQIWDIEGEQVVRRRWPGALGKITAFALSPDGGTIALSNRTGTILLCETRSGTILHRFESPHNAEAGAITTLAYSPRGDALVAGTKSGAVMVYRPAPSAASPVEQAQIEPPLVLAGHRGQVLCVAFDADGSHFASGGEDKSVAVWNLDQLGKDLARLNLAW